MPGRNAGDFLESPRRRARLVARSIDQNVGVARRGAISSAFSFCEQRQRQTTAGDGGSRRSRYRRCRSRDEGRGDASLERVILPAEGFGERFETGVKWLNSSRIMLHESVFASKHISEARCLLPASVKSKLPFEIKSSERRLATERRARLPVQSAGDHQMQNQPQIIVEPQRNPFADSSDGSNTLAMHRVERWIERVQQERAVNSNGLEFLAERVTLERLDVDRDIGQLGHGGGSSD